MTMRGFTQEWTKSTPQAALNGAAASGLLDPPQSRWMRALASTEMQAFNASGDHAGIVRSRSAGSRRQRELRAGGQATGLRTPSG